MGQDQLGRVLFSGRLVLNQIDPGVASFTNLLDDAVLLFERVFSVDLVQESDWLGLKLLKPIFGAVVIEKADYWKRLRSGDCEEWSRLSRFLMARLFLRMASLASLVIGVVGSDPGSVTGSLVSDCNVPWSMTYIFLNVLIIKI